MTARPLLEVTGLSKRFGTIQALERIDLAVTPGTRLGIIGPNGAGKSTLFGVVAGLLRQDTGAVLLDGAPLDGLPTERRVQLGLGCTFQHPRCFPNLTTWEHLLVAARDRHIATARMMALLDALDLGRHIDAPAGTLSLAEHKLLDVARALVREPRVLLLDEPFAGLAAEQAGRLGDLLRAASPVAMLVIEHRLADLLAIVKDVVALAAGKVLLRGSAGEVLEASAVRDAYLGVDVC